MITDEEIRKLADDHAIVSGLHEREVTRFARAIYQLGRQHQRESDALVGYKECAVTLHVTLGHAVESAILANTGELK